MDKLTVLDSLKRLAQQRADFAINEPQYFAKQWANVEKQCNKCFDENRFNHYQKIIEKQAVKRFESEPFPLQKTAFLIHAWQVRTLNNALRLCKGQNLKKETRYGKMDAIALSLQA